MTGATLMVARAGRHPIAELEQSVKDSITRVFK
jgi:hypothetical protein